MTPTTCSLCAAPLPAVPADQRHPEWCAACAARATGAVPAPPPVPPSGPTGAGRWGGGPPGAATTVPPRMLPMVVETRPLDAVLVGVAAAALAGVGWWASVAFTEKLFVYAAIVVGVIIGQGVLIGARKGGVLPALVAGVLTLGALVVAQYFIERSLAISTQGAEDLPLWLGFSVAEDVVRSGVEADGALPLFWLLSVGAALIGAGSSTRRPAL